MHIKSKYHLVTDPCNSKTTRRTTLKYGIEVLLIFLPSNKKGFSKMLHFSGVNNNYNYSLLIIRIVRHGGPRFSNYQLLILFARRVDKNCPEKFIDKNNLMHCAYANAPFIK